MLSQVTEAMLEGRMQSRKEVKGNLEARACHPKVNLVKSLTVGNNRREKTRETLQGGGLRVHP